MALDLDVFRWGAMAIAVVTGGVTCFRLSINSSKMIVKLNKANAPDRQYDTLGWPLFGPDRFGFRANVRYFDEYKEKFGRDDELMRDHWRSIAIGGLIVVPCCLFFMFGWAF